MTDSQPPFAVSNLQIMRALLAKDWRFFRVPLIALILVGVGCYLIALTAMSETRSKAEVVDSLADWAVVACNLTALLAAAFGGVSIAGERSDRTSDFIALLPVARKQIILSKWTVSVLMLGGCALIHLMLARSFGTALYEAQRRSRAPWTIVTVVWIAFTTSFFGIAWLLSTFTRSGPISACVSIAITVAGLVLAVVYLQGHDRADYLEVLRHVVLPPLAIGLASLIAGTSYYLRRVEP
jgi:ABC-type transport system involved in multi-copper enzyme maturation permease subunit